jgi:hypothetical protein
MAGKLHLCRRHGGALDFDVNELAPEVGQIANWVLPVA